MVRMQKTLEQQLADINAKQRKLKARQAQVEEQRKARDLRRRAKGEKAVLQLALGLAARRPAFKSDLLAALATFPMKPEERDAALWVLTEGVPAEAAPAVPATAPAAAEDAGSADAAPPLLPAPQRARASG